MSVTDALAGYISKRKFEDLSEEEVRVAKHCLLDYLGVAIAGKDEPLVCILKEQILEEGGLPQASLLGEERKVTTSQAALINGSAAHAHDYDDVHLSMSGHPTVPVAPAVLALAEKEAKSGQDLIRAFVTGLDTECILGRYVGASHYAQGFHATGTLGCFGAAAACSNLMQLNTSETACALGISATQAAGLKSMFGTMCKPFHAGKAAANGLLAARLAAGGFTSHDRSLEVEQGFGSTHSSTISESEFEKALENGNHIPLTLFKYHAACYLTQSAMEGAKFLVKENRIEPEQVQEITLGVDKGHFSVCNIQQPKTGLEAKFSLRFTAAMILHGLDTTNINDFNDSIVFDPALLETRDKVKVEPYESPDRDTQIRIKLKDGRTLETHWNVAVPEKNLDLQWGKLTHKFAKLAVPVIGSENANAVINILDQLERQNSLENLFAACRNSD